MARFSSPSSSERSFSTTNSSKNLSISTQRHDNDVSPAWHWAVLPCAIGVLSLMCIPAGMRLHRWKWNACHARNLDPFQQPSDGHLPPLSSQLDSHHRRLFHPSRRTRPERQLLLLSVGTRRDGSNLPCSRYPHNEGISW